jgi:putative flavoprotein involved in K+ transport
VLERGRIGETWLTQRWDSFYLNTSKLMAVMPGDRYEGPDPEGFYTRDEFVALLEDYARRCRLPVATNTPVTALTRDRKAGVYRLITPAGELTARAVVIASGSLNRARRPEVARALPPGLLQIDASVYRSPDALPAGAVLVVGSAQSGGQIAEDLAMARRVVSSCPLDGPAASSDVTGAAMSCYGSSTTVNMTSRARNSLVRMVAFRGGRCSARSTP